MCGFVGLFDSLGLREPDRGLVGRMNATLFHRGPDGEGYHFAAGIGLGHRRLAIIDLESGQQPIYNEDRTVAIVFNGEIYNYRELRRELIDRGHGFRTESDTEVIVHAWEEWREDCLSRLTGMFAFAIWDEDNETLFLARDRLGEKPLYYARLDSGWVVFGSELKALMEHPDLPREIDPPAVEDYFTYGYVPDPRSIFKNVYKLDPAHYLCWRRSREAEPKPYWRLCLSPDSAGAPEELAEELIRRLRESVCQRLVADVPLGAFLSGGIDSSAVVAQMAEIIPRPVDTFTVSFSDSRFDEAPYAAEVASRYGTNHRVSRVDVEPADVLNGIVDMFDEPFADSSALPTFRISGAARQHVKVSLSGDGGDELFAGYRRYLWHSREERVRRLLPPGPRRWLFGGLAKCYPKLDWAPRALRAKTTFHELSLDGLQGYQNNVSVVSSPQRRDLFSRELISDLQGYSSLEILRRHFDACDSDHPVTQAQYLDLKTYLPGDILVKLDRCSMANSLEARVPLLDHSFVEWTGRLPADMKLRGRSSKWILKRALEPYLPRHLLYREKQGFSVPMSDWLRGPLQGEVRRALGGEALADSGLLHQDTISRLVAQHQSGRFDHGAVLWSLLVFSRFLERSYGDARLLPAGTRTEPGQPSSAALAIDAV